MTQPSYCLGIDLGTTYSAAAVCRAGDPRPDIVPLGGLSAPVASMVFLAPDGSMLCGEAAHRRAITDPRLVIREFKRRIGDDTPLVVGGRTITAESAAARFVAWILERVTEREGGPPDRLAFTHPADWGSHKREIVRTALAEHGLADVQFRTEPEAAAIGYASTARVEVGGTVAVYDLGGGTFDAAVVRKLADDRFELVGEPVGIEHLGGVDFDEAVFEHVRTALGDAWQQLDPRDPAVLTAVAGLRRECTAAKEALSADTEVMVPVMLPGLHTQVRLGRSEFEEQIRPAVAETVEALRRAIEAAGTPPDELDAVLMVGGSSRIPLITQLVSAELGRSIAVDADPKSIIAVGAAIAARGPVATPAAGGEAAAEIDTDLPPPCPPQYFDPVLKEPARTGPGGEGVARRKRQRSMLVATVGVAATLGLGVTTVAWGFGQPEPVANSTEIVAAGPAPAGPTAVGPVQEAEVAEVDPWTGEAPTRTTVAGPRRPVVLAAATRPGNRTRPTGAPGATPVAAAPATKAAVAAGAAARAKQSRPETPAQEAKPNGQSEAVKPETKPKPDGSTAPPDDNPPANNPPVNDPPAHDPPANDPPANDPPANDPPVNDPPNDNPPPNDQPPADPPDNTDPPSEDPPSGEPLGCPELLGLVIH